MDNEMKRTFWYSGYLNRRDMINDGRFQTRENDANLVSSLTEDGMHAPVIDLDFPVELVPSSTYGHFHLYLNKAITWRQYRHLLKSLYKAGLIEKGAYIRGMQRGSTYVRLPWIKKTPTAPFSRNIVFMTYVAVYINAYWNIVKWNIKELVTVLKK